MAALQGGVGDWARRQTDQEVGSYRAWMGAERLRDDELAAVQWSRAWRQGAIVVRLGEASGYRWVVEHSRRGTFVYYSERGACDRADRLLSRGVWTVVEPAERITAA